MVNYKVKSVTAFAVIVLIAVFALALGPFLVLWALNTLFALQIPYDVETYLAVLILGVFLRNDLKISSK
jgi:hypothetical protein